MTRSARESSSRRHIPRRSFLRGFGSTLLAVPFFSGLVASVSRAREGVHPIRFVMMFTGNNQFPSHWLPPNGQSQNFDLAPALQPLQPVRQKLMLVHGLRGVDGHSGGMSETTTGRPSQNGDGVATGGPSIDQLMADTWRGDTPLPSLELGVRPGNAPNDQIIYSSSGLPIPAIGSPLGAFNRLFGLSNTDPQVLEQRRADEASVLDVVAKDLSAAQGRLGPRTRVLLDEQMTLIRERERELEQPLEPRSCALHEAPLDAREQLALEWSAQNQNALAALRCGLTRVVSLRAGGWGGTGGYSDVGLLDGHHNVAHGGTSDPDGDLLAINRWHCEQLVELLQGLEAIEEGEGSLLDHCVVVWFNELGLGGTNNHNRRDVPILMAGGSCAGLHNDRYVNLGGDTNYQHFLYTLTQVLGREDLDSFGDGGDRLLDQLLV